MDWFFCCYVLHAWHGSAEVVAIDSTLTDPALTTINTPEARILSLTASGKTHDALEFFRATSVNNVSQPFAAASSPTPPETTTSVLSMVSSGFITQGKANATTLDYAFSRPLDAADGIQFFMYELNLNAQVADDVVVMPLSSGSPIASWSLTLDSADYGAQTPLYNISWLSSVGARGVTFSLADFTGGSGELVAVDGLRFYDSGAAWDPISVGAIVPEPGTLALALLGAIFMAAAGRRRRM